MLSGTRVLHNLSDQVRPRLEPYLEAADVFSQVKRLGVIRSLGPSGIRGIVLRRGKQGVPTEMPSSHAAYFDWTYPSDHPEMAELYRRAKQGQWDGETYLPWATNVDPYNPEVPLLPDGFFNHDIIEQKMGVKFETKERLRFAHSIVSWMLSQFLHGEQGALLAAAQVTEAVQFFDGKFYGATQVMDEARHIEVFHRYIDTKLNKLYQINDNLFVIIDALMCDSRWDLKFLGMQIMVEGLALGAFGTLYQQTSEPLLRELLKMVIQDEARHVHYGVLALRHHFNNELSERERRDREDWAFEVALLMRDRFMAYEVYEEWFEGSFSREQWRNFMNSAPGMINFRKVMFNRLIPNLREIGLMSKRIRPEYERVGLMDFYDGAAADQLSAEQVLTDLDREGPLPSFTPANQAQSA